MIRAGRDHHAEGTARPKLAEVAGGCAGFLAGQAGVALGFHEHDIDSPVFVQMFRLCAEAGADTARISRWIGGDGGAAAAKRIPFTG